MYIWGRIKYVIAIGILYRNKVFFYVVMDKKKIVKFTKKSILSENTIVYNAHRSYIKFAGTLKFKLYI